MLKKVLCLLSMFFILPAYSGIYEDALKENEKVFLYMYTDSCKYCVKFNPVYEKIYQKYNRDCKFVKINAYTDYGTRLMQDLQAYYVPYVAMVDTEEKKIRTVTPNCMLNFECMMDAVEKFVD